MSSVRASLEATYPHTKTVCPGSVFGSQETSVPLCGANDRQSAYQPEMARGLKAQTTKRVGRTAQRRRNRLVGGIVASVVWAMFGEQPTVAIAKLGCVFRGFFFSSMGFILREFYSPVDLESFKIALVPRPKLDLRYCVKSKSCRMVICAKANNWKFHSKWKTLTQIFRRPDMRYMATVFILALSTSVAAADTMAADTCKADLSPIGQEIYTAALAQHPTQATGREIIKSEVEKLMSEGKVDLSEGRKAGEAAGHCLKLLK
ncbi:hypothetical protein [Roseovarius sp. M141]|uniref:hypothetical protein n=1 Tax=Roseovarius sp. M141 TaxID=2583806 RepID=UPI0020CCBA4D|nr:hypothetical protein [Roseovarius sp. M141]MCQ0093332.1 hypothetical protein [Roseovarius sp. M141]